MMLMTTRMKAMLLGSIAVEEVWGLACSPPGSTTQRSGSLLRCNQPQAFECCSRKTPVIKILQIKSLSFLIVHARLARH